MTIFYYLYGYLPYRYFYFKKSLRTSTTTTMRATLLRLVTAVGMSTVPTGISPIKNPPFSLRSSIPTPAVYILWNWMATSTVKVVLFVGIPAGGALRTSALASATIRVEWIRVVASSANIGLSTVPTGIIVILSGL